MNISTPKNLYRSMNAMRWFATAVRDPKNPQVYMDVSMDGQKLGKMTFEVSNSTLI